MRKIPEYWESTPPPPSSDWAARRISAVGRLSIRFLGPISRFAIIAAAVCAGRVGVWRFDDALIKGLSSARKCRFLSALGRVGAGGYKSRLEIRDSPDRIPIYIPRLNRGRFGQKLSRIRALTNCPDRYAINGFPPNRSLDCLEMVQLGARSSFPDPVPIRWVIERKRRYAVWARLTPHPPTACHPPDSYLRNALSLLRT